LFQILSRTCFFIAIPYLYFLVGWLNFRQAGKSATLGALAILALSSCLNRNGKESRNGRLAILFVALLFLMIIAYQGFLRDLFGVAQDNALVMEAIFGTNGSESYEFVLHNSHAFLKHFSVLLGVFTLFALFVFRQPQPSLSTGFFHSESRRRTLSIVLISLFTLTHLNSTMRKENPLLYFPLRYLKWKKNVDATRLVQEGLAGRLINDKSLAGMSYAGSGHRTVVFLLGESSTRLNWSLYGYPRNTNPELQEIEGQLLEFSDVVTTDGSTVLDMQKILTPATRTEPNLFQERPNILTIARKAGYKTFWITNHSTDMTGLISIFAASADKTVNANRGGSRSEGSYDEVVLPHLQEALADPAPLKFILVHLLNAHPAYSFRYPDNFSRFDDVNDQIDEELQRAGRPIWSRVLRDEYDNAILYSDHILRRSVDLCEKYPDQEIAWLYVPDHGEDVAHYNSFVGHNPRVLAMFEIPMLLWRSSAFNHGRIEEEVLSERPYQTDQLDHTLLGLMGIKGDYYDGRRDILSESFVPLPRFVAQKAYSHL
jgi:heptose-I-phosphate ethanolaminephosphotransferase